MQIIITADQSRAARRELGLSQADVANAVNINRQYVSEFETGYSNRITSAQQRKLVAYYESKIEEANAGGEEIALTFGEGSPASLPANVEAYVAKRFSFQVADEVTDEMLAATASAIAVNDKRLVELLTATVSRDDGVFGSGDYTADTLEAFRESFALLSANYLLIRALGGWQEIGLSATGLNISGDVVLAKLIAECRASFESAGFPANPQAQGEVEPQEEVEA